MTRPERSRSDSRWGQADFLLTFGYSAILGSGIVTLSDDRFGKLTSARLTLQYFLDVLSALLLVIVIALVFRWIFAVTGELRLLREHLAEFIQPVDGQAYFFTVAFSLLLGALAKLSDNIAVFSLLFAIYSAGDIWGQWLRDRQLERGFSEARSSPTAAESAADWDAIERYYLGRPQMHRSATIMFFSFIALSISLVGRSIDSRTGAASFDAAAYAVVIANIVISEVVIGRWRRHRDATLGEHYSW